MSTSFPIGRILGIPIRVHLSWFVVLGLVTSGEAWQLRELATAPAALVAGLVSALLLFSSVLLHELGHCVAARAFGIHVRRIQLFLFGGVAEILGEPRAVLDEVVIAAAGPAVSISLAVALVPAAWLAPAGLGRTVALFALFANVMLFAFNMVPAFPTDGGRILRALLWGALGDYRRATRWAAGLGIAFASLMILGGIAMAWSGGLPAGATTEELLSARFGGAWMSMVGLFLARSARAGVEQARVSAALRDACVGDAMLPITLQIDSGATLLEIFTAAGGPSAAEMLLGFSVAGGDGACLGFVEPANLFAIPRESWGSVRAGEVMTPIAHLPRLAASDPLDLLVREIVERGAAGALIFDGERLVGYAGRSDVARFLMESRGFES